MSTVTRSASTRRSATWPGSADRDQHPYPAHPVAPPRRGVAVAIEQVAPTTPADLMAICITVVVWSVYRGWVRDWLLNYDLGPPPASGPCATRSTVIIGPAISRTGRSPRSRRSGTRPRARQGRDQLASGRVRGHLFRLRVAQAKRRVSEVHAERDSRDAAGRLGSPAGVQAARDVLALSASGPPRPRQAVTAGGRAAS
jgi:hypothetical protein